jgi:hypothetical protein
MSSPLRLFPTSAIEALLVEQDKLPPRDRLWAYIKQRDGDLKAFFYVTTATSPASAFRVTFQELIHKVGLSVKDLVESKLVGSWMDCVSLGITLDEVIVDRSEPFYNQCNIHLLRQHLGKSFEDGLLRAPLKVDQSTFVKYAERMRPEDLVALNLLPDRISAWLIKKSPTLEPEDRRIIRRMLSNAKPEEWRAVGLDFVTLNHVVQTTPSVLSPMKQ